MANNSSNKTIVQTSEIPDIPDYVPINNPTIGNKINKLFSSFGSALEPVVNRVAEATLASAAYASEKLPDNDLSRNYKMFQNLEEMLLRINQRLDKLDDRITAIEVSLVLFDNLENIADNLNDSKI